MQPTIISVIARAAKRKSGSGFTDAVLLMKWQRKQLTKLREQNLSDDFAFAQFWTRITVYPSDLRAKD